MSVVPIRKLLYPWEAELLGSRLRAAGIECTIVDHHARTLWTHAFAIGGATVLVDAADLEAALALANAPLAETEPEDRCPRCGSESVARARPGAAWLLASAVAALPLPTAGRARRCSVCAHRWRPSEWSPTDLESPRALSEAEAAVGVGRRPPDGSRLLLRAVALLAVLCALAGVAAWL